MWSVLETLRTRRERTKAETRVFVASLDRRWWMELMRRSSKLAECTRLETWVFIVKWQPDVTPRFLTESNNGTDAQPTVIKSGKEKERDLDFRPEDTIIASVLSSFSLSLFNVIQDLMSSIHFCIERKRSGIWWGGADFWSWESSAYEWWRTECFSITVERGAV